MVPMGQVSMRKLAAVGQQSGKLWRWKRSHHQWIVQFKWKWQKPWRLSEWIHHSDATLLKAKPRPKRPANESMPFTSHVCWNQLRSMGEAKNLLQYMFSSLSEARCQSWENDLEIKEMKDQYKEIVGLLRQSAEERSGKGTKIKRARSLGFVSFVSIADITAK